MPVRLAVAILLFSVSVAHADKRQRARDLFLKGKQAYAKKQYKQAIDAFRKASRVWPSPILTFNIGRSYERLGNASAAIRYFRLYLRQRPKAKNRAKVLERITALKKKLVARKSDPYEDLEGGSSRSEGHGVVKDVPAAPMTLVDDDKAATPALAKSPTSKPAEVVSSPKPFVPKPPILKSPAAGSNPRSKQLAGSARPRSKRFESFYGEGGANKPKAAAPKKPTKRDGSAAKKDGPLYKKWWFWVAIAAAGGIAAFVISTASSGGGNSRQTSALRGAGLAIDF
jgi:tetratricopeptide (TPR) repeat protein